jgi:hypothetical protein
LPFGSAVALGGLVTSVHLVTPLVDTGEKPGTGSLEHSGPEWQSERNFWSLDGFRARSYALLEV